MNSLNKALPWVMALTTPYMAWKALCVLTNSTSPVMCVVSESMAPAFHRGDILFLSNRTSIIHAGDIPVVWFPGYPLPMVHRAVNVWYEAAKGGEPELRFLTKGDNNDRDDVSLYPQGRLSVMRSEVVGMVAGYLPCVGWLVIWVQEAAWLRYVLVAVILILSLI